jgi:hypothetical protein
LGYVHFGDPDSNHVAIPGYESQYLFVPVEGPTRNKELRPSIAVFSAGDLKFLSSFKLSGSVDAAGPDQNPPWPDRSDPWLAIRPGERTLWASPSESSQIQVYDIDWEQLEQSGKLNLTFRRQVTLKDRQNHNLNLTSLQGGVFNEQGTLLYVMLGACDTHGYIYVFAIDDATNIGILQARSENGYGPFDFETHPTTILNWCTQDEAEGLDWLDTRTHSETTPDGQLHAVKIDNDLYTDKVTVAHYSY